MTETQAPLALTTKAVEPTRFTVDDEPYELYGMAHLNPNEEAEIMSAIAQYQRLATRLAVVASRSKGVAYAKKMYDLRIELLLRMTNLPEPVAKALPIPAQLELFSSIVAQLGEDEEEIEDEDLKEESPQKVRENRGVVAKEGEDDGVDEDEV